MLKRSVWIGVVVHQNQPSSKVFTSTVSGEDLCEQMVPWVREESRFWAQYNDTFEKKLARHGALIAVPWWFSRNDFIALKRECRELRFEVSDISELLQAADETKLQRVLDLARSIACNDEDEEAIQYIEALRSHVAS